MQNFVVVFQRIIRGDEIEFPVFQILSSTLMTNPGRLRLHISDGLMKHTFAIFNVDQSMYEVEDFSENTIIRVPRFACSQLSNER